MTLAHAALIGVFVLAVSTVDMLGQNNAIDWPQWRGPNRDAGASSVGS